ncbi:hypothetical protein, partial [Methanobrevibacter cuticularis]|uniref:hypothetical protein n=1 Tax=Methanobrevibacter cuticularis TaxID=47311 RepID=UPI000B2763E4
TTFTERFNTSSFNNILCGVLFFVCIHNNTHHHNINTLRTTDNKLNSKIKIIKIFKKIRFWRETMEWMKIVAVLIILIMAMSAVAGFLLAF